MNVRLEEIAVRIPTEEGEYHAIIVLAHGDGVGAVGLGEASLLAGRSAVAALAAARECAELDLRARVAGVPLAELLGGIRRREVECSALLLAERASQVARAVERAAARGFRCFKLKALAAGGPLDLERLGAARWAAGRAGALRFDFNGTAATESLHSLEPFHLELVEQPLPASSRWEDWSHARAAARLQLAADESLADGALAVRLSKAGVGLAIKLATVGGPRAAMDLARQARGPVTIGSSLETSIGLAAGLHVACALEQAPAACGLATAGRADGDLAHGLHPGTATLRLPDGPGLGVALDTEALARYRLAR